MGVVFFCLFDSPELFLKGASRCRKFLCAFLFFSVSPQEKFFVRARAPAVVITQTMHTFLFLSGRTIIARPQDCGQIGLSVDPFLERHPPTQALCTRLLEEKKR